MTFDTYDNMYLSDVAAGTITMIPKRAFEAVPGARRRLGDRHQEADRAARIAAAERRQAVRGLATGLVYYDGERAYASLRFGMSGQVKDASGAPLSNAHGLRSRRAASSR